jgi:hypothetical protein
MGIAASAATAPAAKPQCSAPVSEPLSAWRAFGPVLVRPSLNADAVNEPIMATPSTEPTCRDAPTVADATPARAGGIDVHVSGYRVGAGGGGRLRSNPQ